MTDRTAGTILIAGPVEARTHISARTAGRAIVLTPAGRVVLDAAGVPAIPSDEFYSDRSHARVNVCIRAVRKAIGPHVATGKLDPAAAEMLMLLATEVTASSAAMWELLRGPGPWCVYNGSNLHWSESRVEAHRAMLGVLVKQYRSQKKSRFLYPETPFPALARLVFAMATTAARSKGVVVLHEVRRGLDQLVGAIESREKTDVITIGYAPSSWRVFASHAYRLIRGNRNGLRLMPPLRSDLSTRNEVKALLSKYRGDAVVERGLEAFSGLISDSCAQVAALSADVAPALKRLGTRSVMVWDSINPKTIAYAHAGRRAGAKVFVVGHAAVSVVDEPAGRPYSEFRAATMTAGEAVDVAMVQSPTMAAAASVVAPHLTQVKTQPFLWRDTPAIVPPAPNDLALFLWAGNFGRWSKQRPWVEETPDEMMTALVRFAEAIIATPNARLEVRIKPNWKIKADVDAAALDRYVPKHERIVVTADGSFGDSLGRATAVVTHASTAFEESLRARVPVVLWGARGRSHFVPGRVEPPVGNSRASVYAPAWGGDLPAFLRAVAEAHRGQPLTDAEVSGLVWDDTVATLNDVATMLARPETVAAFRG